MDKALVQKLAESAELDYKKANSFSVISYYSEILDSYTCPTCIPGVGEEALTSFIVNSKRACHLGQVPKQNIGLKCMLLGEWNDSSCKFDLYDEPVYLFTLEEPGESTPIKKFGGVDHA